jgi:hypothetical protein
LHIISDGKNSFVHRKGGDLAPKRVSRDDVGKAKP